MKSKKSESVSVLGLDETEMFIVHSICEDQLHNIARKADADKATDKLELSFDEATQLERRVFEELHNLSTVLALGQSEQGPRAICLLKLWGKIWLTAFRALNSPY